MGIIYGQAITYTGGTDTSDATASANEILSGYTAYVNDVKITGAIISKSAATYTPTTSAQTIASGQYLSGSQTIQGDANLVAGNILYGKSIFGVSGTLRKAGYYANTISAGSTKTFYDNGTPASYSTLSLNISGHGFTPSVAYEYYTSNATNAGYGDSSLYVHNQLCKQFSLATSGYAGSFTSSSVVLPTQYSGTHHVEFAGYY